MRTTGFVLAVAVTLFGTACSSGGGGGGGGCTESNAVDLAGDNPFTITVDKSSAFPGGASTFTPDCFKASSSSAISIVNEHSAAHTFTIPNTQVDVPLPAGQTFNGEPLGLAPGTYDFVCTIHPEMTGTVIVV